MYLFTYSCGIILFFIRILIQGLLVAEGNKTYLNLPPPPQKKNNACLRKIKEIYQINYLISVYFNIRVLGYFINIVILFCFMTHTEVNFIGFLYKSKFSLWFLVQNSPNSYCIHFWITSRYKQYFKKNQLNGC